RTPFPSTTLFRSVAARLAAGGGEGQPAHLHGGRRARPVVGAADGERPHRRRGGQHPAGRAQRPARRPRFPPADLTRNEQLLAGKPVAPRRDRLAGPTSVVERPTTSTRA